MESLKRFKPRKHPKGRKQSETTTNKKNQNKVIKKKKKKGGLVEQNVYKQDIYANLDPK